MSVLQLCKQKQKVSTYDNLYYASIIVYELLPLLHTVGTRMLCALTKKEARQVNQKFYELKKREYRDDIKRIETR